MTFRPKLTDGVAQASNSLTSSITSKPPPFSSNNTLSSTLSKGSLAATELLSSSANIPFQNTSFPSQQASSTASSSSPQSSNTLFLSSSTSDRSTTDNTSQQQEAVSTSASSSVLSTVSSFSASGSPSAFSSRAPSLGASNGSRSVVVPKNSSASNTDSTIFVTAHITSTVQQLTTVVRTRPSANSSAVASNSTSFGSPYIPLNGSAGIFPPNNGSFSNASCPQGTQYNYQPINIAPTGTGSDYATSCLAAHTQYNAAFDSYTNSLSITYASKTEIDTVSYNILSLDVPTADITTDCDGFPRVTGPTSTLHYSTMTTGRPTTDVDVEVSASPGCSSFGETNWPYSSPTCSVATQDCSLVNSIWSNTVHPGSTTQLPYGICTCPPNVPCGTPSSCTIQASHVQLFYWPQTLLGKSDIFVTSVLQTLIPRNRYTHLRRCKW